MSRVKGTRTKEGYKIEIDETLTSGETLYVEWDINGDEVWADVNVQMDLIGRPPHLNRNDDG